VIIGGIVVIALAVGGWWYLNQSSTPSTSDASQQSENTSPVSSQTPTDAMVSTEKYVNSEFGISFSHPIGWSCKTYTVNPPSLYQTICDDDNDGTIGGNAFAVDVSSAPYSMSDSGGDDIDISRTTINGANSSVINVTVSRSYLYPNIGGIGYNFAGSAGMKSYSLGTAYGTGKNYATAEDARKVLDPIVKSLIVN